MKKCIHCGELIPINADICRFCKKAVPRGTPATRTGNILKIIATVIITLVLFYAVMANFYYAGFTAGTKLAWDLADLMLQPFHLAANHTSWIPFFIEYGGALCAAILFLVGHLLSSGRFSSEN